MHRRLSASFPVTAVTLPVTETATAGGARLESQGLVERGRVFSLVSLSVLIEINNQTIQSSVLFHLKYVAYLKHTVCNSYFVLNDIVLIDRQEL